MSTQRTLAHGLVLPGPLAGLGVLMLGLSWSLGVVLAQHDLIAGSGFGWPTAIGLVLPGGIMTVAAIWFGLGAVAWAMGRILGGTAGIGSVLLTLSATTPCLWPGAAAAAFVMTGAATGPAQTIVAVFCAVSVLAYLALTVGRLEAVEHLSAGRVWICAGMTAIFCASCYTLIS